MLAIAIVGPEVWPMPELLPVALPLVAVASAPDAHGRVWHVPSGQPRTQRQALTDLAAAAGLPQPAMSATGASALRVVGLVNPTVRELLGTLYQFTGPFVLDDRDTRERFGLEPERWDDVLARVVAEGRVAASAGRAA